MQITIMSRTIIAILALFIVATCTQNLYGQYPGPADTQGSWIFGGPSAAADPAGPHAGLTPLEYTVARDQQGDPNALFPPAEKPAPAPATGKVSVVELQHPLSRKGKALMAKATDHLLAGKTTEALADLERALVEPSAAPYAHSLLGATYLRMGRSSEAIPELEQAVKVLPTAVNYSNLGLAHCLNGDTELGERELEHGIQLDSSLPQAHYLVGVLLLNNKAKNHEACEQLERAEHTVHKAHMALAVCYVRAGQDEAADRQVKEYVGSADDAHLDFWESWARSVAEQARPSVAFGLPAEQAAAQ